MPNPQSAKERKPELLLLGALMIGLLGVTLTARATCDTADEPLYKGFELVSFEVVEIIDPKATPIASAEEAGWRLEFEQRSAQAYGEQSGSLDAHTAGMLDYSLAQP